ncbi:MAG: lysophospholipid acyltransferase family protein [Calditrichia bacterium]
MRKKIRQKIILFLAQIVARPVLLLFRQTLRIRVVNRHHLEQVRKQRKSFIFCLWHEYMILPLLVHDQQGMTVLVSQHFDGEIIARILKTFGLRTIRGSSTRGGTAAYKEMKRKMQTPGFEMVFTPDGPTGPRRQVKAGIVRLASELQAAIVPLSVSATRYRRLNSWDRLFLILPFSRCILLYGKPIYVPPINGAEDLKIQSKILSEKISQLDAEAEKWLSG